MNLYPPNQLYFNNQIPTYKPQIAENQYGSPQANTYYNIGGMGYNNQQQNMNYNTNGGYYNGIYNNLYNPYEERKRQEQYQKQVQDQFENQKNFERALLKNRYAFKGMMLTDEELDNILAVQDPYAVNEIDNEVVDALNKSIMYDNAQNIDRTFDIEYSNYCTNINKCIEKNQKSDSLMEYFNQVNTDIDNQYKVDQMILNSNMRNMYNSNDYNSLLDFHNNIQDIKNDVDISDMAVPMPMHLKNEMAKRREQFLNSLINR